MRFYRIRKFPSKAALLLLLIIVILLVPDFRDTLKRFAFHVLTRPFHIIAEARGYLIRVKSLSDENLALKERLAMQSVALARLRELSLENERLHAILDFEKKLHYRSIVARVIGRDSTDWRKGIIINKGRKHGIKPHMACATAQGIVGSVVEVGYSSSKVMLITDANSKVGVILRSCRESGVLTGFTEGMCKVLYLSLDAKIEKGEGVVVAGFSAFFPKGLVVGEVIDSAVDRTGLYKYAIVKPAVHMNRIEEVICIDIGN